MKGLFLLFLTIFVTGCEKGDDATNNQLIAKVVGFNYNDTIDLGYGKCVNDYNNQFTFCFDSVMTDSRCPVNVICIWAGEAIARFRVNNLSNETVFVDLHTGIMDTVIYGYKISFLDLLPYPNTELQRDIKDYNARIIIKKNTPE